VKPNYREINAEAEEADPQSVLNFYRRCLRLRKESDTLLWGDYREYFPLSRRLYVYERSRGSERILIVCSFSKTEQTWQLPGGYAWEGCSPVLCNYPGEPTLGRLRPYEAQVLRWDGDAGDAAKQDRDHE
jgi:oligo-1,6-glucosidase